MGDFFKKLFVSDFMPHGHCFFWRPDILWLHLTSDALIVAAYYSIPLTLLYFLRKRPGLRLNGLILMFAGFILACGTTHLVSIWDLWHSTYRLEGLVKGITAILSVATAVVTLKLVPQATKIPTPEEAERANDALRQEVGARKEAEQRLIRHLESERLTSEQKLKSFFEAAPQAIVAVTKDGKIALVNKRTEEMFGYERLELLGKELEILMPERFQRSHVTYRGEYFADPRMRPMGAGMSLAGRRRDGTEFPVEIGLSHVEIDEEHLALGLIIDITERKRAEDAIARINSELRRSYTELEQFTYVASHDLQEPLRMITNYLQLLERRYGDKLDADGKEFLQYAMDGAVRMKTLILDLLRLSRAGTQAVNFQHVNSSDLLEIGKLNLASAIQETAAQITSDPLPVVVGDAGLLGQVFQNLIANAIKFQAPGAQPHIHVSAKREENRWIFSVRDNGIGIHEKHVDRIFRMFERLHNAESYGGSGVGLAISQRIVERHGGRIWVESKMGQGSTFYFSVPGESERQENTNP